MNSQKLLSEVIDELGYFDSSGYVDASAGAGGRNFVWNDLRTKCGVDAAYFNGSVPVVAFVAATSREGALLAQRRLWNYGRVPVLIATTPNQAIAFSCNVASTPAAPDAAVLSEANAGPDLVRTLEDFSRFSVESGQLARRYEKRLNKRNRVDVTLLNHLKRIRDRLINAGVLESEIEPLLGRSIFVKYLEDRAILRPEDLESLSQSSSLGAALSSGWYALNSLFDSMSDHFNGDVFRKGVLTRPIRDEALVILGDFFQAVDPESGQQSLWPYDFSIIAPELISSIYEELLVDKRAHDAAYYTPRRVVDLVLDELLPIDWGTGPTQTILDPACGSGIFLTEAFRRLVYHRRAAGKSESYQDLSQILVDSIFGIDLNQDAVGVTAFGLYLTLLEYVDPRTIWLDVQLPNLIGSNLVTSDFFAEHLLSNRKFDLIVGNPPWKSKLSPSASRFVEKDGNEVPDNQIAAAFVWQADEMLSAEGSAGFVLPSKTFLHNRSRAADKFRIQFFSRLSIRSIIDLSPLRKELFGAKSPAAIAIFNSSRTERAQDSVLHVSPRRTPVAQIVDGLAIPQQNIQRIPRSLAQSDPSIWKVMLWGGPDDEELVRYLRENFIALAELSNQRGWYDGTGYQQAGGGKRDATHLAGIPQIATQDLHAMQRPAQLLPSVSEEFMHFPRAIQIYRGPHILMRKGFREFPEAAFVSFDATFTDGLSAIAGARAAEPSLQAITAILNSRIARYWFLMTSSSWGVEREQLHHREWMSLPIPELTDVQIDKLAGIVSAADYGMSEETWRPLLEATVEAAYSLTAHEQQVISDALEIRWSELHRGWKSAAYQPPNDTHYGTYARELNGYLNELEIGTWTTTLGERSDGFAMVTCYYNDGIDDSAYGQQRRNVSTPSKNGSFSVKDLLANSGSSQIAWTSDSTIIEPQAIILEGETVHVLKPDRLSCWPVSDARRDAADIFSALLTGDVSDSRNSRA
ncbi:hypothetical protein CH254_23705 [Rhodococcus sp. 06-412-2C]|uniref:HsdM family class I SAM-dependent methyltransferase n=1 Tax=unclassified Rhodococcus (in: high G+C Gram-positive bacteria) TaxID=192944 RepID=UPI000B9B1649|nr:MULTISPECIES: N-6 DNA methylase [unclassified Rhodococcus (in: high G+C Gram-positive bacteria)]OZC83900.1 hypothetical protein CH254_23705 [Rhodococcus sp. 06-412-2C]OZC94088.1 hypothetical protein CH279_21790 [Rhodococcus sp. 06-412-2B]